MIKVYIASPYAIGDPATNVRRQIDCADELLTLGYLPIAPLMFHFHQLIHPRSAGEWLKIDLEYLKICHCVLRLNGESKGADGEVKFAMLNNIAVFYSIVELQQHDFSY